MTGIAAANKSSNPAHQLIGLTLLMVAMYVCMRTLRFTNDWFNLAFVYLFLMVPLLATPMALRLPRRWHGWVAVPFLLIVGISMMMILATAAWSIPALIEHRELNRELSTVQQGRYSVCLSQYRTAGGALGPQGVLLEQRMNLLPWLYAVKCLDYFEGAFGGSISAAGPDRIELHIPGDVMQWPVDRVYQLKPWLYF